MDHLVREQRLEAMGVRQWYARARLPGAARSPVWLHHAKSRSGSRGLEQDIPLVAGQVDSGSSAAVREKIQAKALLVPAGCAQEAKVAVSEVMKGTPPVESELGQADQFSIVQCHISLYRCGHYALCSVEGAGEWSPSEHALLTNILLAIGLADEECQLLGEFSWPVFSRSLTPLNSEATFVEVCAAWLDRELGFAKGLLLFHDPRVDSFLKGIVRLDNAVVRVEASLSSMLADPVSKARVWRQLQPQLHALAV